MNEENTNIETPNVEADGGSDTEQKNIFTGTPVEYKMEPERDIAPERQAPSNIFRGAPQEIEPAKEIDYGPMYDLGSTSFVGQMPSTGKIVKEKPKVQYPNAPTIAEMPEFGTKAAHIAILSDDPDIIAKSIIKDVPNAQYRVDTGGYPYLQLPPKDGEETGQIYYIDRPGFNLLDFSKMFLRLPMSIPTQVGAAALSTQAPAAAPVFFGAAGAADAAARQAIVSHLSGENAFDLGDIAKEGFGSVGGYYVGKGLQALKGEIGKTIQGLGWGGNLVNQEAWDALPRGVRDRVKAFMANAEQRGGVKAGSELGDMLLDDPNFVGAAKAQIRKDTPASQQLASALMEREQSTPQRIEAIIQNALGPRQVSKEDIFNFIKAERIPIGKDLQDLLANAQKNNVQIDTKDIVRNLDEELINAKGRSAAIISHVKNLLKNPTAGETTYVMQGGYESMPFDTRPVGVANALYEINSLLKKGGKIGDYTLSPGDLRGSDVGRLLTDTSKKITNQLNVIPGYEAANAKYIANYNKAEAAKLGYEFGTTDSKVLKDFLKENGEKELLPYAQAAAREKMEEKLRTSPNDLRVIKKASAEGDYSRDNLSLLFGPKNVDTMANEVEKEATRRANNQSILKEYQATGEKTQAKLMGEAQPASEDLMQAKSYIQRALKFIPDVWKGRRGPEYEAGMSKLLSENRDYLETLLKSKNESDRVLAEKFLDQLPDRALASSIMGSAVSVGQAERRADGGRIAYKSGGRVKSARAVAEALMREIDLTRKQIGKKTEDILSMPDDAVATALKIARGNV